MLENVIRLSAFFGVFALMAAWEALAPRRTLDAPKGHRWGHNLALLAVGIALLRLLPTLSAVAVAEVARKGGWGLFNAVALPAGLELALAVILLDFTVYLQHVLGHMVPLFWRLHKVHHADNDLDVTTGLRFHPLEIVLSLALKMVVVAALGPSVLAVVVFEAVLNATAMFNHGNVRLPPGVDGVLRLLVVTPDMHRVHHSVIRRETNSNYGFSIPWWDRLCGTYRARPAAGHDEMTIGLDEYQRRRKQDLWWLLALPFK